MFYSFIMLYYNRFEHAMRLGCAPPPTMCGLCRWGVLTDYRGTALGPAESYIYAKFYVTRAILWAAFL